MTTSTLFYPDDSGGIFLQILVLIKNVQNIASLKIVSPMNEILFKFDFKLFCWVCPEGTFCQFH
jgi:hypothetical protein